jgi:hypothetical protein
MRTDSGQGSKEPKQFRLGPLGNLTQVTRGLARTIRAMADGTLDSQVGARICNGLGIMRQCLETGALERIEERLNQLEATPAALSYGVPQRDRPALTAH